MSSAETSLRSFSQVVLALNASLTEARPWNDFLLRLSDYVGAKYATLILTPPNAMGLGTVITPAAPAEGSSVTAHSPAIVVRLNGITDSALLVELSCWFLTRDFAEFQLLRHEVLLQVLERMDAHHVAPGYPARTLRLQASP